jgi:hypothetical protein
MDDYARRLAREKQEGSYRVEQGLLEQQAEAQLSV